ncbi:MAG: hypothetical protein WBM02_09665 [bacterium]
MKIEKKTGKFIFWTPRILAVIFILFLALFSLDVFENNHSTGELMLRLLIHNIPSIILAVILWISWKHEIVGAIAFILAGIFYIVMIASGQVGNFELSSWWMLINSLAIAGPALFIGILFLIGWRRKKNVGKRISE